MHQVRLNPAQPGFTQLLPEVNALKVVPSPMRAEPGAELALDHRHRVAMMILGIYPLPD